MVSWLPMRGSIKYSSHREWGHHRAHVHAGLVDVFCTWNDLMIILLFFFSWNLIFFCQTYAPTTLAAARDFWTLRYTTSLEDGSLVVWKRIQCAVVFLNKHLSLPKWLFIVLVLKIVISWAGPCILSLEEKGRKRICTESTKHDLSSIGQYLYFLLKFGLFCWFCSEIFEAFWRRCRRM